MCCYTELDNYVYSNAYTDNKANHIPNGRLIQSSNVTKARRCIVISYTDNDAESRTTEFADVRSDSQYTQPKCSAHSCGTGRDNK